MAGDIRSGRAQLRVAGAFLAALLGMWRPADVASATILPSGTYGYTVFDGGKAASTSRITVTRSAGNVVISEHAAPMEPAEVTRRTLDAATFAALSFTDDVGGRRFVTVEISGDNAVVRQDGRTTTLAASPQAPFAVFDAFAASFFQLPAVLHVAAKNRLTLANLFLQYSAMPLTASPGTARRPSGVRAHDRATAITIDGNVGTLWYDPGTYVLQEFDLPSQRLAYVLTSYVDVVESLT